MKRREALKKIGFTFGYIAAAPAVLNILQSCQASPIWNPTYFTSAQAYLLEKLGDLILPKTDLPSASELNIPAFVEKYILEVSQKEERAIFENGMDAFSESLKEKYQKDSLLDLKIEEIEPEMASVLKVSKKEEINYFQKIGKYAEALKENKQSQLNSNILSFAFLNGLRDLNIFAYKKSSEFVGEKVLAYRPVPGKYEGCVDLQESTQGKAWSL